MSGVFRVDEQNEAMLFRFGALQTRMIENEERAVLTSGRWYWAWPYPIDWVKVLPAQRTVTISTETLYEPWVKPEQGQPPNRFLRPGADGYLLTGDTNIIHASCEVNYRIRDPQKYYLKFLDEEEAEAFMNAAERKKAAERTQPGQENANKNRKRGTEGIMQNMLGNALLSTCATWTVEDLRTKIRTVGEETINIEDAVQMQLEKYLKDVDLGIEVQSVKLTFQLPYATLQAFDGVFEASEMGNAEIQKARLDAATLLSNAEGMAAKIRNDAMAYKRNVVESVRADSAYFKTVLEEYKKQPETMLTVLYTDALRSVLGRVDNKYVVHQKPGEGQEVRLQIGQVPEKSKSQAATAEPQAQQQ
jgi:membrane protease subunit HflK